MRGSIGTIWYFMSRLLGYGLLFGFIFGSFTYPMVGTGVGTIWGAAVGATLGLILGGGIAIRNRFLFRPNTDGLTYQSNLSYTVGLVTLVLVAIPLLMVYTPVAVLTAAYVAHRYAADQLPQEEKRKNEDRQTLRDGVVAQMVRRTISKAPIFVALAAIGGALLHGWNLTQNWWNPPALGQILAQSAFVAVGIAIYSFILAALVGLTNGLFINFLNHLHFAPDTPKQQYKRQIVPLVMVTTLLMTIIAAGFFGAPVAALVAGWGASSYADWYYQGREKAKREAQHHRLMDETGNEALLVEGTEEYWLESEAE